MVVALVHSRPLFFPEPYLEIQPTSLPWLVKGVLPTNGVAFLVGASKAGKSFLAIDFALRIASGGKVLGRSTRRGGVIYLAAEDAPGCRARVAAWRRQYRRHSDTPFDLYTQPLNLLDDAQVDLWMDALEETVARFDDLDARLGCIMIDTLSRCIPGVDENSSPDMSRAFVALQRIGLRFGCLLLVLAHFGKAGEEKGIRGWSGMDANSDATLTLERDKDDPGLRTILLAKVKNGQDGARVSFRLQDVDLGIVDEDGEAVSSCICAFEMTPPDKIATKRKAMNPPEKLVFDAIKYLTDHSDTQPIPEGIPGVKPWHKGLRRGDIQIQLMGGAFAYEGEKQDSTRKRFDRALQGLNAQGRIRVEKDLIWLV